MLLTRHGLVWALWAAVCVAMVSEAAAQDEDPALPSLDYTLQVDVDLVTVNVTVLDNDDRIVPGLPADAFTIYEDGMRQALEFFQHENVPASIGLVLDNSRSIASNREHVVIAALQFLALLDERDEVFVLHFSDEVLPGLEGGGVFSTDHAEVADAVRKLRPIGLTRLYDAVEQGLDYLEQGRWPRKALIILSDGGDTASQIDREALEERIRDSDAPIFPIGIVDPRWKEADPRTLRRFAEASGGMAFFPDRIAELPAVWFRIARLIHEQYTLGYASPDPDRAGYREIRVDVRPLAGSRLTAIAREGYVVGAVEP